MEFDDETKALIASLLADTEEYFGNEDSSNNWNTDLGMFRPAENICTYLPDAELTALERDFVEGRLDEDMLREWNAPDVCLLISILSLILSSTILGTEKKYGSYFNLLHLVSLIGVFFDYKTRSH